MKPQKLDFPETATVEMDGKKISVKKGEPLRAALLRAGVTPHNGQSNWLNCKGLGTCGTCAVAISGPVTALTKMEEWRLNFPPHQKPSGLRLACQVRCLGDVVVTKHPGFWGEEVSLPIKP